MCFHFEYCVKFSLTTEVAYFSFVINDWTEKKKKFLYQFLQGVQDQIFQKELAVASKLCIPDPKLVNTKCVSLPNISFVKSGFFQLS